MEKVTQTVLARGHVSLRPQTRKGAVPPNAGETVMPHAFRSRRQRDRVATVARIPWPRNGPKGGWNEKKVEADGQLPRGRRFCRPRRESAEPGSRSSRGP